MLVWFSVLLIKNPSSVSFDLFDYLKLGKQSFSALLAEILMSFKAVRLVRDLPFKFTAWSCSTTASIATIGDVLFFDGCTRLVNLLP